MSSLFKYTDIVYFKRLTTEHMSPTSLAIPFSVYADCKFQVSTSDSCWAQRDVQQMNVTTEFWCQTGNSEAQTSKWCDNKLNTFLSGFKHALA